MRLRDHQAIRDGKLDMFRADPRHLIVQEGYNVRDLTTPDAVEKLHELANSIAEIGVTDPLVVRFDGERIVVVEGHRRLMATMMAIKAGAEIKSVPIYQEARNINDAQRDLDLIISNSGEPLTALEKAKVVGRLVGHGWSHEDIRKKCGWKSVASVLNYLDMLAMPEAVKQQVRNNDVSATTALKITKDAKRDAKNDPDFAAELIRKNKEENKRLGVGKRGGKVTAKTVKRDKEKAKPKPPSEIKNDIQTETAPVAEPPAAPLPGIPESRPIDQMGGENGVAADLDIAETPAPIVTRHSLDELFNSLEPIAKAISLIDLNETADDAIVSIEIFGSEARRFSMMYAKATGGEDV